MSLTFCNLHFTKQPDKVVYVSNALMKSLNLSGKKRCTFASGVTGYLQRSNQSKKQVNICISLQVSVI